MIITMAKSIYTFIFCLFSLSTIVSQNYDEDVRRLYYGGEVGFSLPAIFNQNNYGYSELNYKLSGDIQLEIHAGIDIHAKQYIQVGLQYSGAGQKYQDIIADRVNEKDVMLSYLQMPITYKRILDEERGFAYGKLNTYLLGGLQLGLLTSSNVEWFIDGAETDMLSFIDQTGNNSNYAQIIQDHGTDFNDKDLYRSLDANVLMGLGFQYFQTEKTAVFFEFRGTFGLLDINDSSWRYNNNKGVYRPSLNTNLAFRIGVNRYFGHGF